MNIRLTPAARADVEAVGAWYSKRGQQLRADFHLALERTLLLIQDNPHSGTQVHGEIRRVLLNRFPYCLFYIIEANEVVILACLHGHRDPEEWKKRHDA